MLIGKNMLTSCVPSIYVRCEKFVVINKTKTEFSMHYVYTLLR